MIVLNPRDWVTLEKPDKGKNHDQIKGGNGALETNAIQLQRKEDNHILHHWVGLYISNPCVVSIESLQFSKEVVTPGLLCYKEEPILTPRWLYFFYFNLCFLLLCSVKGYCLHVMACLREPCTSAWMLNQNAFVQDLVHLWMATGRKKLTHPLPEAGHSGR